MENITKLGAAIKHEFREAAHTNSGNIHIVQSYSGWAVKREGAQRAANVYDTKEQSIKRAQTHSAFKGKILIHPKDGTIQDLVVN